MEKKKKTEKKGGRDRYVLREKPKERYHDSSLQGFFLFFIKALRTKIAMLEGKR